MLSHYFDPLYKILAIAVKFLFGNYNVFLVFVSLFFFIAVYNLWKIADKKIKSYNFAIFLVVIYSFYFPSFMGGQREALAISLSIISLKYLIDKKIFLSFFWWICSFLFHQAAILFLINIFIFYLISDEQRKFFKIRFIYILLLNLFFFGSIYFLLNSDFIDLIANLPILNNLVHYQGMAAVMDIFDYGKRNSLLISERIVFNLLAFIGLKYYQKDKINKFFFVTYTFGTFFYIFFIFFARNVAGRGIQYFRFSDIFILSTLPQALSQKIFSKNIIKFDSVKQYYANLFMKFFDFIIFVYFIARFIYINLYANSVFYLPYQHIFSH
jgi:hypothetical protein